MGHSDDVLTLLIHGVHVPSDKMLDLIYSLGDTSSLPSREEVEDAIKNIDPDRDCPEGLIEKMLFGGSFQKQRINIPGTPYYFIHALQRSLEYYGGGDGQDVFIALKDQRISVIPFDCPKRVTGPSKEEKDAFKEWLKSQNLPYEYGKYLAAVCVY